MSFFKDPFGTLSRGVQTVSNTATHVAKKVEQESKKIGTHVVDAYEDVAEKIDNNPSDIAKAEAMMKPYLPVVKAYANNTPTENNTHKAEGGDPVARAARDAGFLAVSVGGGPGLSLKGAGVALDGGSVWEIKDYLTPGGKPKGGYVGYEWSVGVQHGVGAVVPFGFWRDTALNIGGDYVGVEVNMTNIIGFSAMAFASPGWVKFLGFVVGPQFGKRGAAGISKFGTTHVWPY